MHPQNAMLETSRELCSARPRTGEPNATFGCTEATTPVSQCLHVHSINASVGPSPDEATTATWCYHRNQQFSITAVTTSSGSVAERYAYTAYGQPTILDGSGSVLSNSAINNRYTYTGREWDQTLGLYHFRARWMSGLAGRFMGRDPIGYEDGSHMYAFLSGSALSFVDPTGTVRATCTELRRYLDRSGVVYCDFECRCPTGWEIPLSSIGRHHQQNCNIPPTINCNRMQARPRRPERPRSWRFRIFPFVLPDWDYILGEHPDGVA
jgi:RHS repeat-associated protein